MPDAAPNLAQRLIDQSDIAAERLIGVIRMVLATMLFCGILFIFNQLGDSFSLSRRFELTLTLVSSVLYFCLGLATWLVARSALFRPWLAWLFTLLEVGLIAFNIYFDVTSPDTSSLFALTSPLLLVLVLVLVVQALRYRLELHVAVAIVLIAAILATLLSQPVPPSQVSKFAIDEILQMYQLQPNIMRVVMLGAVAVIVGMTIVRSRRLLEQVAMETELLENQRRFLPRELTSNMSDAGLRELRTGQTREIVAMFVDIRDFTSLSENMNPSDTVAFLSRFRSGILDVAPRNGAIVDKFMGDGALLVFGLEAPSDVSARQALNVLGELHQQIAKWNEGRERQGRKPVRLAIAIHAGTAMVGTIGDDRRLEFTVTGPVVNLASRLEAVAKTTAGGVAVSAAALKNAGELPSSDFKSLGKKRLKGASGTVEVFESAW